MLFNMGVLFDMFYNMAKRTMSKRTNVKQKQFGVSLTDFAPENCFNSLSEIEFFSALSQN